MATITQPVKTQTVATPRPPLSLARILIYTFLIIFAIASVTPFVYMVMNSLKTYGSTITNNLWPWPPFGTEALQFQNYPDAIKEAGIDRSWNIPLIYRYFLNSLITVSLTVAGVILTSVMAAYALANMDLPGKNWVFLFILATIMVPGDLTLVPKVVMMFQLKWYNTYAALIIPFLASVFGIFLMRQFFLQIPRDLFDAALIDGAGHLTYLFRIVVPLSRPAIVTTALLNFIWTWDSFKWPLLVTKDANMRVLAVGLQQFVQSEGGTETHLMMAFATMVTLPIIILYFFTQKYFQQGVISTGIKG
ncbi:MAG: carbohydrate ABC transporter permease [Anaerolineae bacterium]|nr:carbohydrate ABC transporter permease [Anaerolineae bacterium]